MHTKIFLVCLALSLHAWAEAERNRFVVPSGPSVDIIKETQTLKLQNEATIQKENPPSHLFISAMAGTMQPHYLMTESHGYGILYDFAKPVPLFSVRFTHFPFDLRTKFIRWGWAAGLGYSYSEYGYSVSDNPAATTRTALHVVPLQLDLVARAEWKSTQSVIPFAMGGPLIWTYFQRGLEQLNTSEALFGSSGTLGVAFNLNRMDLISSRSDTEIFLQYQRIFSSATDLHDLNGNTFQLGGTLAL